MSSAQIIAQGNQGVVAQLGISIEPLQSLLAQLPPTTIAPAQQDPKVLAERIGKHLFDYLSSFFPDPRAITPDSAVPMGAIKKWYDVFLGKLARSGTGFLEKDNE
jgi:hypothetical protein